MINKQTIKFLPVDVFSIFDSSKENNASKSITEEKEEHANDDEEAFVHADYHSQQQHLQSHLYQSHTDTHARTFRSKSCYSTHSFLSECTTKEYLQAQNYTHVLPTYCEKPEDNHTGAHHVGVCILRKKRYR